MAAATATLTNPILAENRFGTALESYRALAGGMGMIFDSFGANWAQELYDAQERVLRAYREFIAEEPSEEQRERVEHQLDREGIDLSDVYR